MLLTGRGSWNYCKLFALKGALLIPRKMWGIFHTYPAQPPTLGDDNLPS